MSTRIHRQSPRNGNVAALAIFLHGVGSSGADIAPVAEAIQAAVPSLAISVPDGFSPSDINPAGRDWFSIRGVTEENRAERIAPILPELASMIEREANVVGVGLDRVFLVGFSQGTIMALHLISYGIKCAGVIGLSGRLAGPIPPVQDAPEVVLLHGDADQIMPPQIAHQTAKWLADANVPVSLQVFPDLAHQIDRRVLEKSIAFLEARVALPEKANA